MPFFRDLGKIALRVIDDDYTTRNQLKLKAKNSSGAIFSVECNVSEDLGMDGFIG